MLETGYSGAFHWDVCMLLTKLLRCPFCSCVPTKCCIQTVLGLQHMHSQGVLHRDIKSLNLLLDAEQNIKIADLGIATVGISGTHMNHPSMYACNYGQVLAQGVHASKVQPSDLYHCG